MTAFTSRNSTHLGVDKIATATTAQALYDNLKAVLEKDATAVAAGWVLANSYVVEAMLAAASVSQGKLKTALNSSSVSAGSGTSQGQIILSGGEYCFAPTGTIGAGSGPDMVGFFSGGSISASATGAVEFNLEVNGVGQVQSSNSVNATRGTQYTLLSWRENADDIITMTTRYVQASPPYDLGNGKIPLFAFLAIDKTTGAVKAASVAADPPWAHNGYKPQRRLPHFYRGERAFRLVRDVDAATRLALVSPDPVTRAGALAVCRQAPFVEQEITQAMKNEDMNLVGQPWVMENPGNYTYVMMPICPALDDLTLLADEGENVSEILAKGYFKIDNVPLDVVAPSGVEVVDVSWKLTG